MADNRIRHTVSVEEMTRALLIVDKLMAATLTMGSHPFPSLEDVLFVSRIIGKIRKEQLGNVITINARRV